MEDRERIPEHVKEGLRAEVGYGCPICRSPFLTWHHFDPPHRVRPHNDPNGMIALCREHADEADNDNWPPERLRGLKNTPHSVGDIRGSLPSWQHENILVRLGGSYVGGSEVVIAIEDQPLVRLRRNSVGLLALSFNQWDIAGNPLLTMIDNVLELYPNSVHDFVATARKRKVKLWLSEEDVGLDLSFDRISLAELAVQLQVDFERSKKKTLKTLQKAMHGMDHWQREFLEKAMSGPPSVPPGIDGINPEIRERVREGFRTGDNVGAWVTNWARERCIQSDGKIPFLDFKHLSFFFSGKRLRVRDGLAFEGLDIDYTAAFDNALGAFNLRAPA